jgi:peptide/nickel transport system permease protein
MPDTSTASPTARALRLAWTQWWFKAGCLVVGLFILAAIYAPFLATEVAWWWSGPDGWSMPVLGDLFNRRSYPQYHDLLFNLLAVLLPILGAFWWLVRRRLSVAARLGWCAGILALAIVCAQVPVFARQGGGHQALWDDRPTEARTSVALAADPSAVRSSLLAPIPHRWDATYPDAVMRPPGTVNRATGSLFSLGTDPAGHDVAARLLFGARISLTIGLVATGLSILIGTIIGAISGFMGGKVDLVLQRLVEIMMCFPTFILILVVVAMTSRNIFIIMTVIGLTGWAGTARLVRGEFLAHAVRDYVTAARSLGLPSSRIMFRHVLPNVIAPLLISVTFGVAGAILGESGLSFIGLGDPTTASWGQVLDHGRENPAFAWLIYAPGLALFVLIMALYAVGEGLRQALDPKASA